MRKISGLWAAMLPAIALAASPVMAQQAQPDQAGDQATLNQFLAAVASIEANLRSSPDNVVQAGSQCSAAIDALTQALPKTIISDFRCDVGDSGGVIVIGGAAIR